MKNLFKTLLSASIVLLITSCNQNSPAPSPVTPTPAAYSVNVFSTFLVNGQQLGASAVVTSLSGWQVSNGSQQNQISLCFTSPSDGKIYGGFFIKAPVGVPLHLGSNPNCSLTLMDVNHNYMCDTLNVNLTKITTTKNDTYEGTFSGNVTKTNGWPLFTNNVYPATGSFKVPLI